MTRHWDKKAKKKLYLFIALGLALILSSGTFAYTYVTSIGTIGITPPTADVATCNTAASQPDWASILVPPETTGTEILNPNAAGDKTDIQSQIGSGAHWQLVDDWPTDDGDSTIVYTGNTSWEEDLYNLPSHTATSGNVTYVKVDVVCRADASPTQTNAYVHIKTNGTEANGPEVTTGTSYSTFSRQWDTNPVTGDAWTWDEMDSLQIGVGLRQPTGGGLSGCTQVYAEIGYGELVTTGDVPTGDLFTVHPNPGYNGDLQIGIYLTNTGPLIKAYQYLNMQVYMEGSVSSNQTPNHRLLTLQNGQTTLSLENLAGVSDSFFQTSRLDFEGGNLTNLDTSTSPDNVILDTFADNVTDNFTDESKIAYKNNVVVSNNQVKLVAGGAAATETFRPNAAGDDTDIASQYPDSGAHWDKVNDVTPDDYTTYIYTSSASTLNWYSSEWQYRKKITINSANVSDNLTDFPVLVSVTDTDLKDHAKSDASDIVFTASDGTTKLKREIESYDNSDGTLVAWVKTDLSSTTDTEVYLYYGYAGASETSDTDTWDTNFIMIQHMTDETTSSIEDSTTNNNDGTKQGAGEPAVTASGKIGDAQDFDGSNDKITVNDSTSLSFTNDEMTIEVWVKADTLPTNETSILRKDNQWQMAFVDSDTIRNLIATNGITGWTAANDEDYTFSTDTWYYWTFVYNGPNVRHMIDAQQVGSSHTVTGNITDNANVAEIGRCSYTNEFLDGIIDELRISNVARSDAWIETSYNNQSAPGDFFNVGSEESAGYERDLYNIPDHSTGSGVIDSVNAYFSIARDSVIGDAGIWRDTNNTHTIGALNVWTDVPFNSENKTSGSFNHTSDTQTDLTADGWYLIMYEIRSTSTSNTRHSIWARVTLEGSAVEGSEGFGYVRDNANDEGYTAGACIVNASANDTVVVQWRPYGVSSSDVLSNSKASLFILRLPDDTDVAYLKYADDSDTGAYGGTSWAGNEVTWADQVYETDNSVIQKSAANDYTFTLKKVARYLVKYDITFANSSSTRTARIARATLAGSPIPQSFAYCHVRNNVTTPATLHALFIVDNPSPNQDLIIQSQRGDSLVDSTVARTVSASSIEIMELPSSAEVITTYYTDTGEEISGGVVLDWAAVEGVRDASSFTISDNETIEVEQDDDYLFMANGLITDTVQTSGTRFTFGADWYVDDSIQYVGGHGNYMRHVQGTVGVFNTSINAHSILNDLDANQEVEMRTINEGDTGTPNYAQPDQCGFSALRIGSLSATNAYARAAIKPGDTVHTGTEESTADATFTTKSYQWTTNPDTGQPWTWDEIDALQVGVELKTDSTEDSSICTQVYLEVDYTAYSSPGTLTSINLLSGETVASIDTFNYDASAVPSGTGLKVQFSTDNSTWYNSAGTPGGWDTMPQGTGNISLSGLGWSGPNLYYNTEFTSDGSDTPLLDLIRVYFSTYYSTGDLTSATYDTGDDQDWDWEYIYFTIDEPGTTDIRFQIRSASTEAGLSSATWYGPTGTGDYYTASGTEINSVHDGDRWIQYRADFSGPGDATPTLSDIELTYTLASVTYTVEIIGGSYGLVSSDTSDWASGWTITPEFYCEVTQR